MASISFAKVQGAGVSAPVSTPAAAAVEPEVVEQNADVAPQEQTAPSNSPAVRQPSAPSTGSGFYSGEEDDIPIDRGDVRLPRLNIIQGLSGPELKKIGADGTLVLNKSIAIPQPARIVVAGCSRKRYAEKLPKFGEGEPRIFDTLEEVIKAGGTDQWKHSRENKDKDGIPVSRKPWFTPMVSCLLLIEKPENCAPEIEEHFSAVSEDGKAFAPCVFTVKSTSYGSFYVPIISAKSAGVLRHGFYTHYVELTTKQVRAFEPVVRIVEPTNEAVRKLAKTLLT